MRFVQLSLNFATAVQHAKPVSEVIWRSSSKLFDCSQGTEHNDGVAEEGDRVDVTIPFLKLFLFLCHHTFFNFHFFLCHHTFFLIFYDICMLLHSHLSAVLLNKKFLFIVKMFASFYHIFPH